MDLSAILDCVAGINWAAWITAFGTVVVAVSTAATVVFVSRQEHRARPFIKSNLNAGEFYGGRLMTLTVQPSDHRTYRILAVDALKPRDLRFRAVGWGEANPYGHSNPIPLGALVRKVCFGPTDLVRFYLESPSLKPHQPVTFRVFYASEDSETSICDVKVVLRLKQ